MIYDPSRKWNISETELTFANDNGHFLYVKVPIAEGDSSSTMFADESDHIEPLRDDGFIIYKWGYINPVVDGVRDASMLHGNVKTRGEYIEAPQDNKAYGRKNKTWVEVSEAGHDHEIGDQVVLFENNLI